MDNFLTICSHKRRGKVLCMWKVGDRLRISRGSFHTKECWWPKFVFSRNECKWLLLQLQYQLGGGNLYEYGQKLGEEKVKELYALKQKITKWDVKDYETKIKEYQDKLSTVSNLQE